MGISAIGSYVQGMIKTERRIRFQTLSISLALAIVATACGSDGVTFDDVAVGTPTIVGANDVDFVEISPFARFGPAQGDFTAGEHGTFGIFGAGEASPPHTHSGAYYAVVIEGGEMSNPFGTEESPVTLAAGSFWSVPADAEHVTACLDADKECRFFFHAAAGFDFFPLEEMTTARDAAAESIPVDSLSFEELDPYDGAALVWGDQDAGPHGTIIRINAGDNTSELTHRNAFTAVPATGSLNIDDGSSVTELPTGSVIEFEANTPHSLSCGSGSDCLVYLFSDQALEIRS